MCSSRIARMGLRQSSLFDTGDRAHLRELGPSLSHTDLGAGAWVDVQREWVGRADLLFDALIDSVSWRAERRRMYDRVVDVPRLVAFFENGDQLPHPLLVEARDRLGVHYGQESCGPVRTVGLCLYRDGSDSVAWHGDTLGRHSTEDTVVAIVSLGEPRRFLLRPTGGGSGLGFDLAGGDLLVMGGSCQRNWQHSVPKRSRVEGPRISVQFRSVGVR